MKDDKIRIAALGDLHLHQQLAGSLKDLFIQISEKADILALCGDLTDHGHPEEAQMLVEELRFCKIPVVGVLGNHDYASNKQEEIIKILSPDSMFILEEEPFVLNNKVGIAGVKGFGGGFDKYLLGGFGEEATKQFVYEGINEVLKLENSLSKLETEKKVVVLHYSPIRQTIEGEPLEIYPFLGSSRLVEPIDNFNVMVVFHGHSHLGKLEGKTDKGIAVYNATKQLLEKLTPKQPFVIVEI